MKELTIDSWYYKRLARHCENDKTFWDEKVVIICFEIYPNFMLNQIRIDYLSKARDWDHVENMATN